MHLKNTHCIGIHRSHVQINTTIATHVAKSKGSSVAASQSCQCSNKQLHSDGKRQQHRPIGIRNIPTKEAIENGKSLHNEATLYEYIHTYEYFNKNPVLILVYAFNHICVGFFIFCVYFLFLHCLFC